MGYKNDLYCTYSEWWSGGGVGGELASDCHILSYSEDKSQ